jgi:hypothetical protein
MMNTHSTATPAATLEDRLRAVEDRFAILDLIASHPLTADTGSSDAAETMWGEAGQLDLPGGKSATGAVAIAAMLAAPGHQAAIEGGLAHFCGLPKIELHGDRAFVTSYLLILAPQTAGEPVEVPNHGTARGFRVHRAGANRWELARSAEGWKIVRRTQHVLDGSDPARALLRQGLAAATR